MTEVCRRAAEEVQDTYDQDQFKLCVKAITSTVSCLVTSIKSFKRSPSESLLRRVVSFCDPVIAASAALLAFATEDSFIGSPAQLTERASEMYRASLGLSVSISSAIIQMFRAVRDLVHASSSSKRHQDRLSLCVESLTRSSGQFRDMLLSHSFVPNSPHSSHIYEESRHPFVPSSSASLYVGDKGGSSPVASTSAALSQEGERQSSHWDQGLLNSPVSEVKHRQSRLSSSPQQSPKLHTPERHSKHFHSSLSPTSKTPKASKNDKDSSRSPRAKEKRHKSSSSTSSSSSHQSHAGKERLVEGRGDKKQSPGQDSNQYLGADNSGGDNNCLKSNVSERDHERVSEFFFSESSPFSPGSRPTSMDVEVVLASLDPDNSSTHSTANSSSETLPGLRELHLDGAGEDDGGGEESCDL
ncbi:mesoderm development candidate 1 [Plakobranchus ocellatus]|uniref:Mesoderm development candidate 1 n=1 Tax=Plakobranchus ocellatus TaxID=259542 RepID=A0AAV4AD03_9GAST|nr:mesoderm development candidate 1 [Plakobranchus ocellatus]